MLNESQLLAAGYERYKAYGKPHADFLYQKRITNSSGTKYFIDVFHYPEEMHNGTILPEAYVAEMNCSDKFRLTDYKPQHINIVEENMELFWGTFWGKYYRRNDEE